MRRTRLRATATVIAMGLTAASMIAFSVSTATAAPCADEFIGIRGSGEKKEKHKGMGEVVEHVYDTFSTQKGITVEPYALLYPAEEVWPPTEANYLAVLPGVKTGIEMLKEHIDQSCAKRIVLSGYSQGAWVIQKYLESLTVNDPIKAKLRVLLFGSPKLDPNDASAAGNFDRKLGGVLPDEKIPSGISGRTYCIEGDPVCNSSWENNKECAFNDCSHFNYTKEGKAKIEGLSYTDHGADWLTSRFGVNNLSIRDVLTQDGNGKEKRSFKCGDPIRLAVVLNNGFGHTIEPVLTFKTSFFEYTSKPGEAKAPSGIVGFYTPTTVPNAYPEQKLTVSVTYQGKKVEGEDYFTIVCAWDA